jgi:hypothetical protein
MARQTKGKRFTQFALLAFMAGELSYAAAEVLVLRSVGPSARRYPPEPRTTGTEQEHPYFCQATSNGAYLITQVFRARINYAALRQGWRDYLAAGAGRGGADWGTDGDDRTDCFPGISDIEGRRQNQIGHYRQQGMRVQETAWAGTPSAVRRPGAAVGAPAAEPSTDHMAARWGPYVVLAHQGWS